MIKNTNIPAMEQAVQVIFDMSADTTLRECARLREKTLHDEASALQSAKEEGIAIGEIKGINSMVEKMRKSGMTEDKRNT